MNQTITPNSFQNWCQDPNRETLGMGIVNMTPDYDEIIKMVQTLLTLEGTSAVVTAGIMNGARIVRVHDVKEIKMVVTITEKIRTAA